MESYLLYIPMPKLEFETNTYYTEINTVPTRQSDGHF